MTISNQEIRDLIRNWSKNKINESQTFDDVFKIDGIPIWWLLQYRLYSSLIPHPFKILPEIEREFVDGKVPDTLDKFKFSLLSILFRKYLSLNEFVKLNISKFTKKGSIDNNKKGVLFIDYLFAVKKDDDKIKLLKSDNIFKKILKDGKLNPVLILCDPISRNSFFKLLEFENLVYKYIDNEILKESRRLSKNFATKWRDINIAKKRELFKLDNDKNLWPFVENELNLLFSETILNLVIKYYLTFKKIIKENNIEVAVVETFSGLYNLSINAAARTLNKKIIFTPHSLGMITFIPKEFSKNMIFAVGSSYTKKSLLDLGLNEENMRILGIPVFDDVVVYKEKFLKEKETSDDKNRETKTIILLTSALAQDKWVNKNTYFRYTKKFIEEINQLNKVKVIIKLHPREKYKKDYEKIVKSLGYKNVEITQEIGNKYLYDVILKSDLVIINGSTTGIESLILGKCVVNIDITGLGNEFYTSKCDAILSLDKDSDIKEAVRRVLYNKKLQKELEIKGEKYLKENFYMLDGRAYERVVNLIYDLCKVK